MTHTHKSRIDTAVTGRKTLPLASFAHDMQSLMNTQGMTVEADLGTKQLTPQGGVELYCFSMMSSEGTSTRRMVEAVAGVRGLLGK